MNTSLSSNYKKDGLTEARGRCEQSRVIVFGGYGLIGRVLTGKVECYAPTSKECDVRDFSGVNELIKKCRPHTVINLSGQSDSQKCESEDSYQINVNGVTNICYALATHCAGAKLFQAGSINQVTKPADNYSCQKTKAAAIADSYSRVINVINARLCTVEGDYRKGFIISEIIKGVKNYEKTGNGFVINDMGARKWALDVDTLSDAILKACHEKSGGHYYFGPALYYTLEEIFCEACFYFGLSVNKIGNSWIDVKTGKTVMSSKFYSREVGLPDFGERIYPELLQTNLSRIINTIMLSS